MNRAYRDYCRHMGAAMFQRPIFTDPTLSSEELLAVYQTAKSTDLDILRDTAVQMFPEQLETAKRGPHRSPAKRVRWGEEPRRNERALPAGRGEGYGACGDDGMAYPY